ncbi:hypothetical protein ACVIGB_003822 [Bradyrhizobium sp. USDA 4341]
MVEHLILSRGRTGDHVLRLVGFFQNDRVDLLDTLDRVAPGDATAA